jgi:ribulose-phosphate 3-epimerase
MNQCLKDTIPLSKKGQFYISTISEDPKFIFDNLPVYEKYGISGIHFDVMDGNFVPRLGLFPELLKSIKNSTILPIEAHLMLSKPNDYIKTFIENGAERILVHFETLDDPEATLKLINELGAESCVVLNPNTSFFETEKFLPQIGSFMLMAINPGIPKHPFIPNTMEKLSNLRNWLDNFKPEVRIGVDGGVTFNNVQQLFKAGANWLICGSGTAFEPRAKLRENLISLQKIVGD